MHRNNYVIGSMQPDSFEACIFYVKPFYITTKENMQPSNTITMKIPLAQLEDKVIEINNQGYTVEATSIEGNTITLIVHPWIRNQKDIIKYPTVPFKAKVIEEMKEDKRTSFEKFLKFIR